MLTFEEVSELCQKHKIELTIVSVRSFKAGSHFAFSVSAEYNESEALRLRVQKSSPDLAEAVNSAFAEIFKISREGFKFPIMLEGPAADVA